MGAPSDLSRLAFCALILQLWTSSDCSVFRAVSFGGAQQETFDDVTNLGLSVSTPFRVSTLQVRDSGGVMSFQAGYLVYDASYGSVISPEPRAVTGYSSTAEPAIDLVLNAGDLIESMSGYSGSSADPGQMGLTTVQSVMFTIRRNNGSREVHSVGPLVGQLQTVVGPIVGFWGGVGDMFDQLGVYVDPTLWPDRPTRMLKHELHGRLINPAGGSYFDDVIDLGTPYVLRIVSLSVYVQGGTSIAGIKITYESPVGVITEFDHGVLDGANLGIAVVFSEGDYITRLSVERGQETAQEPGVLISLSIVCHKQ